MLLSFCFQFEINLQEEVSLLSKDLFYIKISFAHSKIVVVEISI